MISILVAGAASSARAPTRGSDRFPEEQFWWSVQILKRVVIVFMTEIMRMHKAHGFYVVTVGVHTSVVSIFEPYDNIICIM